jgi:hypothetical protein
MRFNWPLAVALLLPTGPTHAGGAQGGEDLPDLSLHRWRSRVVVVSAPSASDAELARMRRHFADRWKEAEERDIVLVETPRPGPFTVHLVGKDGGVKLRREGPVALDELFAVIDAMPMRREERRQRAGGAVGTAPRRSRMRQGAASSESTASSTPVLPVTGAAVPKASPAKAIGAPPISTTVASSAIGSSGRA